MFNYFRSHTSQSPHKRAGSNPASPSIASPSQQWDTTDAALLRQQQQQQQYWVNPVIPGHSPLSAGHGAAGNNNNNSESASPISPLPPQLPPIPRVASQNNHAQQQQQNQRPQQQHQHQHQQQQQQRQYQEIPPDFSPRFGDMFAYPPRIDAKPATRHTAYSSQASFGKAASSLALSSPEARTDGRRASSTNVANSNRDQRLDSTTTTPSTARSSAATDSSSSPYAIARSSTLAANTSDPISMTPSQSQPNEVQRPTLRVSHPTQQKTTKTKLNLLNPMNLLSRRRTSHGGESPPEPPFSSHRSSAVPAMRLPDDYDPRIKGAGVHDFNAPRTRRNPSTSEGEGGAANAVPEKLSVDIVKATLATEHRHQPVFVENFDSTPATQDDAAVRREHLANMDFVKRISRHVEEADMTPADIRIRTPSPASADAKPTVPAATTPVTAERVSRETVSTAYRVSTDRSTVDSTTSHDTGTTSPAASPSGGPSSRASPGPDLAFRSSLPSHMVSNASRTSRFSFQQNESSLAQERALEEKHKQKNEQQRQHDGHDERFDELEEEEDPSAYDDYDFDGDEDDDIPYIGEDTGSPPTTRRVSLPANPAPEAPSFSQRMLPLSEKPPHTSPATQKIAPESAVQTSQLHQETGNDENERDYDEVDYDDEDDMYFDGGMSEDDKTEMPTDHERFDESTFDSMPHNPRYDVPRLGRLPADERGSTAQQHPQRLADPVTAGTLHSDSSATMRDIDLDQVPTMPESDADSTPRKTSNANRLNAYHSALASAANRAAEVGRFSRQPSVITSSSYYGTSSAQSELSPADSVLVQPNIYEHLEEEPVSLDDYDTDLEDDPMVAAANAEVLATEDADYYSREFGFYGSSSGTGPMYNGGYFGTSNNATGNAVREPNLTPITERSEFSTRNSFISIQGHGSSPALAGLPGPMPWNEVSSSPGLKDLMGQDEDDMTLGQLMKLRRETFGGSGPRGGSTSSESSPTYSTGSPMYMKQEASKPSLRHVDSSLTDAFDPDKTPRRPEPAPSSFAASGGSSFEAAEAHSISEKGSPIPRQAVLGHRSRSSIPEAEEFADGAVAPANSQNSPQQLPRGLPKSAATNVAPSSAMTTSHARSPPHINRKPVPTFAPSDIPVLQSPQPDKRQASVAPSSSVSSVVSPISPQGSDDPSGTSHSSPPISPLQPSDFGLSTPAPTADKLQKLASRPPPDAYRRFSHNPSSNTTQATSLSPTAKPARHSHMGHQRAGSAGEAHDTVAYVLEPGNPADGAQSMPGSEPGSNGLDRWYLERRRTTSTGEIVVVGRELVQSGRI